MATTSTRRTVRTKSARPKAGKPGKAAKRTAPKKAAGGHPAKLGPAHAKPKPAAKPVKVAKAAAGKPAVKVAARPAPPIVAAKGGKPAPPIAAAKGGKVVPAKLAKSAPAKKLAPKAPPVVKPLGVLPPESRARVIDKPASPVVRPRPALPATATRMTPPGAQRVTEKDMKFFEERLLAERQKILKDIGHLETTVLKVNQRDSSGDLSGYSFHMADAGTDAMEREKAFMFASAEGRILMEIDDALRRLYKGEYGMCEICGNPIARARLEAMPYARLCVSCKEKEERASRGQAQSQGPGTGTGPQ
jgi:DnaK suppressor protein